MNVQPTANGRKLYAYMLAEIGMYCLVWLGATLACYLPVLLGVAVLVAVDLAGHNLETSMLTVSGLVSSLIGVLASFFVFVVCLPRSYFREHRV
jgi:hypothetical protein